MIFLPPPLRPHIQSPLRLTFHRAGDMFKGLKSHSTLYVLHHSTQLGSLDPIEVIDILKMRPRIPSRSSGSTLLSPPPQFSRGTTPLKQLSIESAFEPPSPLGGGGGGGGGGVASHSLYSALKLKPEQLRDIAIFRSFCALKLVFDAIWSSVELRSGIFSEDTSGMPSSSTKERGEGEGQVGGDRGEVFEEGIKKDEAPSTASRRSQRKTAFSSKAARKLELGSEVLKTAVGEDNFMDDREDRQEMLNRRYKSDVTNRLQEARICLASIFPLNYRLEVLENIFSLLLVTSDDLRTRGVAAPGGGGPFTNSHSSPPKTSSNIASFIGLLRGRHEFLVDEKLAAELLGILQDCIRELRAAKYVLTQQSDPTGAGGEASALPPRAIKCSVSEASLKARTTKLEQFVNEARWRLQLVSTKQGIAGSAGGGKDSERGMAYRLSSSEEESLSEMSESEGGESPADEARVVEEGKRGERRKKKKTSIVRSESKDDGSGSISSCSRAESVSIRTGSTHTSAGGKVSPSPTPSPSSVFSATQPAPRPASFAGYHTGAANHAGLHSLSSQPSPKVKKPTPKQSSVTSLTSLTSLTSGKKKRNSNSGPKKRPTQEDSGDVADVEDHSPVLPTTRRRKRLRSRDSHMSRKKKCHAHSSSHGGRHQRSLLSPEGGASPRGSTVCWMLASPDSLLRMCLKHSNFMRANEVLKMLHMEGQFGEALIRFSEQYQAVSQQLTQQSRHASPRGGGTPVVVRRSSVSVSAASVSPHSSLTHSARVSHSGTPPQPPAAPSMLHQHPPGVEAPPNMNLQVAIMNARSSFDPLQCVYQLLAPSSIHQVLFSGDPRLEGVAQSSPLLRTLMDHTPSLVMLDLVCSFRIGGYVAAKLLEVASERLQGGAGAGHSGGEGGEGGVAMGVGPFEFLRLMSEISSQHFPQTAVATQQFFMRSQMTTLVPPPYSSPHTLLTSCTHPLTPSAISRVKLFQETYREAREKLEGEMELSRREVQSASSEGQGGGGDVFEQLLRLVEEGGGDGSPTSPLRRQTSSTGCIFNELIRAVHASPSAPSLGHTFSTPPTSPTTTTTTTTTSHPMTSSQDRSTGAPPAHHHTGEGCDTVSYVWQFSRYMSKLVELLLRCLNGKSSSK